MTTVLRLALAALAGLAAAASFEGETSTDTDPFGDATVLEDIQRAADARERRGVGR